MNPATPYIFPGALLGSIVLAFFAFSVTSGMSLPARINVSQAGAQAQESENANSAAAAQPEKTAGNNDEQRIEDTASESVGDESERDSNCQVSDSFPEKILKWCDQITRFSEKNDLDPDLVAALILQESGGNPVAYSKSGAVGLMQVMPRDGLAAGFSCINGPCFANRPSINQLEDPKFNIQFGTNMLSGLVRKHGDVREALKAYGPMNVGFTYADIVLGLYKRYRD